MRKTKPLASDRRGRAMMPGKMGKNLPMIAQQNPYASSNMSRSLSPYKKGGRVCKMSGGGDPEMEEMGYTQEGEGDDAVFRKSTYTGVPSTKEEAAPARRKSAVKVTVTKSSADNAQGLPSRSDEPMEEDTRGVSGRVSSKYKYKGTDADKQRNAKRLAEEIGITALSGGAGRLGIEALRVGRAANAARKLGLEKGNAAATGEGAAWGDLASSASSKLQNLVNKYKASEKSVKGNPDGYKKGGKIAKAAPTRYDRMQDAKLQKHEKEPMQIAHKAKKGGSFAKRNFSRR